MRYYEVSDTAPSAAALAAQDTLFHTAYGYLGVRGTLGREKFIKPLQQKVKDQGLWACHLGPELGGQGYGQLKLGLMNEKLGRNSLAPSPGS